MQINVFNYDSNGYLRRDGFYSDSDYIAKRTLECWLGNIGEWSEYVIIEIEL